MLTNPLTKNFGEDRDPVGMAAYEANGGYRCMKMVFDGMSPADCLEIVKGLKPQGSRRCRLSNRYEVELRTHGERVPGTQVPDL